MNEQQVRKIVDDEIKKKLFQLPKVPPHKHDGTDNINIPSTSVIPPVRAIGTRVFFKNNQILTMGVILVIPVIFKQHASYAYNQLDIQFYQTILYQCHVL